MDRTPIIVGNWKCYKTPSEALALLDELLPAVGGLSGVEVGVAPTYTALHTSGTRLVGSSVKLGAQNVFWEEQGAFTGEISPGMLRDCKVEYVIVGHSERRQYFGETDETVNKRVLAALGAGLKVICCIGETLEEREAGTTLAVVKRQLLGALAEVAVEDIGAELVVAYEPVWAIGTGKVATIEQIAEVHSSIRSLLCERFGERGNTVRIQYGGSVKPDNAAAIFAVDNVDGALVGGASLKVESFLGIVKAAAS